MLKSKKFKTKLNSKNIKCLKRNNSHIEIFRRGREKLKSLKIILFIFVTLLMVLSSDVLLTYLNDPKFEYYLNKLDKTPIKYWGFEKAVIFMGFLFFDVDKQNNSFWMYDSLLNNTKEYDLNEYNLSKIINTQYQRYIFSQMPIYDKLTKYIFLQLSNKIILDLTGLELLKNKLAQFLIIQLINSQIEYNQFESLKFERTAFKNVFIFGSELEHYITNILNNLDFRHLLSYLVDESILSSNGSSFFF